MKTLITICSLLTVMSLEAQIGLGTIKSKVKTATTTNDNSEGSKPKNQEPDDKEKLAISKSPASSVIWDFRIAMKDFEDAPNGPRAKDEFTKAETKLAAIKKQDPSFSYIPDYEKRLEDGRKNLKVVIADLPGTYEFDVELRNMAGAANSIKGDPKLSVLRRSKYDSLVVYYADLKSNGQQSEFYDSQFLGLNNFFNNKEDSIVTLLMEEYKNTKVRCLKYVKEMRQKPDFHENFSDSEFGDAMRYLDDAVKFSKKATLVYPSNSILANNYTEFQSIADDLNTFENGPEIEEVRAKRRVASLAAVRMNKSMMSDAAVIECVKKELLKSDKYKSYKRIIITYSQWQIEKNSFGIPLHKEVNVQFAYTNKEGGCSFSNVLVKRVYNGSTYESMYADMSILTWPEEILCENVNK